MHAQNHDEHPEPASRVDVRRERATQCSRPRLAELGDNGYSQTTVESIAVRAGVHKTTVYRRWGTKGRLLADALAHAAKARH